jgi:hypothetical protein
MSAVRITVHNLIDVECVIEIEHPMSHAEFHAWLKDNGMRLLPGTKLPDGMIVGVVEVIASKLWALWQLQSCRRAQFGWTSLPR